MYHHLSAKWIHSFHHILKRFTWTQRLISKYIPLPFKLLTAHMQNLYLLWFCVSNEEYGEAFRSGDWWGKWAGLSGQKVIGQMSVFVYRVSSLTLVGSTIVDRWQLRQTSTGGIVVLTASFMALSRTQDNFDLMFVCKHLEFLFGMSDS